MKTILTILLLLISIIASGQSEFIIIKDTVVHFDSAADYTYSLLETQYLDDTSEGSTLSEFNKWRLFYENRIAADAPAGENMFNAANNATHSFLNYQDDYCPSEGYIGNWTCKGPFTNYYGVKEYQGRVDAIWIHPDSMNIILAGAHTGGLWKTVDTGHTWFNISDPNPTNNSIIPGTMGAPIIAIDFLPPELCWRYKH